MWQCITHKEHETLPKVSLPCNGRFTMFYCGMDSVVMEWLAFHFKCGTNTLTQPKRWCWSSHTKPTQLFILRRCRVDHVVMEYSPGAWEIHDKWDEYIDLANMLAYLLDLGYTLLHVHDGLARAPLLQLPEWSGGMGEFEEVTADHLQHDMADAKLLQLQLMGCPKPKELKQVGK